MATSPGIHKDILHVLPWEDVIFKNILPYLRIDLLFKLRAVSKQWYQCIESFFQKSKKVHILYTGPKFNNSHFEVATRNAYNVRSLMIRDANHWLSDIALIPFISNNTNLERVDLSGSSSVTSRIPQTIASACPQLRELSLRECHWMDDSALSMVAMNCEKLEKLDVTGCWDVTDTSVKNVARLCVRLKFLSVAKIYGLTDASVSLIAKHLTNLQHLNLHGCWRVSDESIFLLHEYCKSLKKLQVRECRDVSMGSMQKLSNRGVVVDVLMAKPRLTSKHLPYMRALPM